MKRISVRTICLLSLCGCSLAPKYERPVLDMPQCKETRRDYCFLKFLSSNNWWRVFDDAQLNCLEERAIKNNHDLMVAVKNIQEAMCALNVSESSLLPSISVQGSANKLYLSKEGQGALQARSSRDVKAYNLSANLSYEFDIFGKNRNMSKADFNKLFATREAKESLFLTLTSNVAKAYFTLLSINDQLEIARRTLSTREKTYNIYLCRFKNGYCKELDLRRVESEKLGIQSQVFALESAQNAARTALSVLIGASPKEIAEGVLGFGSIRKIKFPNYSLACIPSSLMLNRPDVAAAEYELMAANASIGAARAAFFPSISLTSSYGTESLQLSSFFNGDTNAWTVGGHINMPIFNGGKIIANEKIAKIRYEKAIENYKKVVKNAFKEAKDAIVENDKSRLILQSAKQREAAIRRGYYLAQQQQDSGLIGLVDLLDVERNLLAAQMEHVQAIENSLHAMVNLCKAIGYVRG